MQIQFDVAGKPAELRRGWFTGRLTLKVGDDRTLLQSFLDVDTHVWLTPTRKYTREVGGHTIVVEWVRPIEKYFPALRRHRLRVWVDGSLVADRYGH